MYVDVYFNSRNLVSFNKSGWNSSRFHSILKNILRFEKVFQWKSHSLSILNETMKINNTRSSLKMKVFFWNKVTCRVSIEVKIILNGCVVVIIFIKNNSVLSMNLGQFEENALKY